LLGAKPSEAKQARTNNGLNLNRLEPKWLEPKGGCLWLEPKWLEPKWLEPKIWSQNGNHIKAEAAVLALPQISTLAKTFPQPSRNLPLAFPQPSLRPQASLNLPSNFPQTSLKLH
jgi:hypothetical protein